MKKLFLLLLPLLSVGATSCDTEDTSTAGTIPTVSVEATFSGVALQANPTLQADTIVAALGDTLMVDGFRLINRTNTPGAIAAADIEFKLKRGNKLVASAENATYPFNAGFILKDTKYAEGLYLLEARIGIKVQDYNFCYANVAYPVKIKAAGTVTPAKNGFTIMVQKPKMERPN